MRAEDAKRLAAVIEVIEEDFLRTSCGHNPGRLADATSLYPSLSGARTESRILGGVSDLAKSNTGHVA